MTTTAAASAANYHSRSRVVVVVVAAEARSSPAAATAVARAQASQRRLSCPRCCSVCRRNRISVRLRQLFLGFVVEIRRASLRNCFPVTS